MQYLYHASHQPGLTVLLPHASTHGEAYVYAISNPVTALLFGAPKDDFDLLIDEEAGLPVLWECYPGALEQVYQHKSCFLYTVSAQGFLEGKTGWEPELVSPSPALVLQEETIPDILVKLLEQAEKGLCVLHRYSQDEQYQSFLRDELSERIEAFGLTPERLQQDPRFPQYFNKLLGL